MPSKTLILLLFSLSILSACSTNEQDRAPKSPKKDDRELTIVSYNVENLFDTTHDTAEGEDLNDWAYLPKGTPGKEKACAHIHYWKYRKECFETDWTKDKLQLKIEQIKSVLTSSGKPDLLALNEVENRAVVKKAADVLGYSHFVVTESPDERGADVALLYVEKAKLELLQHKEHVVKKGDLFAANPTRNILEARFKWRGEKFTVFVNHWPSQGGPSVMRVAAAKTLAKRAREILQKYPGEEIVAVGDFNTIPSDRPHPFNNVLFQDDLFFDVHEKFQESDEVSGSVKRKLPPGTYFYPPKMAWNHLDRIFVSQSALDGEGLEVDVESFRIIAEEKMRTTYRYEGESNYSFGSVIKGVPKGYDHNASSAEKAGFSDHFPVKVKLVY